MKLLPRDMLSDKLYGHTELSAAEASRAARPIAVAFRKPSMMVIGWIRWSTNFSASRSNSPASTTTLLVSMWTLSGIDQNPCDGLFGSTHSQNKIAKQTSKKERVRDLVVPSPTSWSCIFEILTRTLAAGFSMLIERKMVAPSLVTVTSPVRAPPYKKAGRLTFVHTESMAKYCAESFLLK